MPNERLWYAVESVNFATLGATTGYIAAHGVQEAGANVRFNLEQVFELGQAEIYENVERQPDIELNATKVLDGYPPLYCLATRGSTSASLNGRSTKRCMIGFSLYTDTQDSASGTPVAQVVHSGMYVNSLNWNFNMNAPFTEAVGWIGNDRNWGAALFTAPTFDNTDTPLALASSGGVNMREDLLIGQASGGMSRFPTEVEGVSSSGYIAVTTGIPAVYLESIRVSCNLNRQAVYALGKRGACHRYMTVPTKVETTIEVQSKQGDNKNCLEESDNLSNQVIYLACREGTRLDLGSRNKLMSVQTQLGNAQGGGANVAKTTYSYEGYSLALTHPQDPSGL